MADTNITDTPIGELKAHPDNPRQGDISAIAGSIQKNGWYGTIVAQRSTGYVLAGNHRLMAAKSIGMETVPVYWVDVDDEQANRILLADNRASDLATYDDSALADILANLVDTDLGLTGTGFDDADLEALLFDLGRNDEATYGTLSDDSRTLDDAADAIEASGIRSIIIPFQIEDYNRVVGWFSDMRSEHRVDSNAEVMLKLVEE